MVSVELTGDPKFEDFGFEPGRVLATGVSQDGGLPGALGNSKSLGDYFSRAGMDDIDIVALSGAHTLGDGVVGFSGAFTLTPDIFSNDYFQNLIAYENVANYGCDYFAPGSTPDSRANTGCHPTNQDNENGGIMQLPTGRALLLDEGLCQYVVTFANNKGDFFKQFIKSMKKMSKLGGYVSVQWCNYDTNYVESMPNSAHASATKPSSAMNTPSLAYQTITGRFQISWTLICNPCIRFAHVGPGQHLIGVN